VLKIDYSSTAQGGRGHGIPIGGKARTKAMQMVGPSPEELVLECWAIARALGDDDFGAFRVGEKRAVLVDECLATARTIESDHERAHQLALIIPFAEPAREDVVTEALQTARDISDGELRCECLLAVAKYAAPAHRPALVQEALGVARSVEDGREPVMALLKVVRFLRESDQYCKPIS
jgi:hypothetical protein